jgi:hypothetical protein
MLPLEHPRALADAIAEQSGAAPGSHVPVAADGHAATAAIRS